MSIILEVDNSDVDIDLTSVEHAEDSFMILNDGVDETSPSDGSASASEEAQSESSDSSFLDIDLPDEMEDDEISTTESIEPDEQHVNQDLEEVDIDETEESRSEEDLCSSIPGMYRILDLISERGTSGLVDKIIIAQDSLKHFLNEISPGAYMSSTKVDFKALDRLQVKPIGIYGCKEEIIRFLVSIAVIDDTISAKLINPLEARTEKPALRSGLYICRVSESVGAVGKMYVVYWPEESTWDDDASPPVRRNRVTFMRYLSKICDQVTALISEDHAKSMIWNNSVGDDHPSESDEDDTDRLFTFEVAKTKEQEESVSVRQGFECASDDLVAAELHPECDMDPGFFKPRLLFGETRQGFMTIRYVPVKRCIKTLNSFKISAFLLQDTLLKERLQISETIGPKSLNNLIRMGLNKRFPDECGIWTKEVNSIKLAYQKDMNAQQKKAEDQLSVARAQTESSIRFAVVNAVFSGYPALDRSRCFSSVPALTADEESRLNESYFNLTTIHPRIAESFTDELRRTNCKNIIDESFRKSKEKILLVLYLSRNLINMTEIQLTKLVRSVSKDTRRQLQTTLACILHEVATPADDPPKPTPAETRSADKMLKEGGNEPSLINDPDFIADLEGLSSTMPVLQEAIKAAQDQAQKYLGNAVDKLSRTLLNSTRRIQLEDIQAQLKLEADHRGEQDIREVGRSLIQKINSLSESCDSLYTLRLKTVVQCKNFSYHRDKRPQSFDITGQRETLKAASLLFTIHLMHLTTQDQHELQLDPTKVPSPRFKESYTFQLPLGFSVSHSQLLEGDKLFLVLIDRNANLLLHLDHLNNIENSIGRERGKMLHRDKIGDEFLLAFDESQAMLALISCDKLQLNVFVYDESRGFTASGSAINLNSWYAEGTTIKKACFTSGSEELLLVDSQAIARVFSLTTMQFRPASLDLYRVPIDVHSSPDGSCFLIVTSDGASTGIVAYHWSTFGSTNGVTLPIADWAGDSKLVISSFVRKSAVHLLKLDLSAHACSSVALDITRKVTEFMFREKNSRGSLSRDAHLSAHNCLMDCHADVWTRFPVLPAVQRATISSGDRCRRSILFVTDWDHNRYQSHFADMIETFEKTTKKPTGDKLSTLQISATTFDSFIANFSPDAEWDNTSIFKVGEWVVDILCLIPIHLALARDNRFIPLKDGIYSAEVEKSLLGAEINRIVDSISFGWYESIFQSYMADKPVRVVSSMGEQSVGKSFALNHLVDTSFAGSAMRTTEGVWMSVTPTKEALIVALDFEGVHSIERSAQEDALLVLFNTAISNLVLFRNNFALSRDITGLFQSFQSSSTVLDPVANPALFQSTLVIIIKDVVDSDKTEIAREFSLKFQQIVEEEQDANFISRLHGGKLNIIPWPVIESKEFYKLFPTLKRRLDQQDVTHKAAGEFLHLMKTLMAKLKANDWGALTQTMASHRAQLLLTLLPIALAFGLQDVEPEIEPLKNLDTDMPIDFPDSDARFFVANVEHSQTMSREEVLNALAKQWDEFDSRQLVPDTRWAQELAQYLEDLAEMRIDHVWAWVKSNLTRFQAGHASVMELQRTLESAVIDLKSSVQLCRMQCESCQLFCIRDRFHEDAHDCKTMHTCTQSCEYCAETGEGKKCSMTAGHSGKHICSVNLHLCGAPCKLRGKNGCLEECAKVSDHEDDDHQCAAVTHACGEPCDLCTLTIADGWYNCKGRCRISVDVEHESHQCDTQYCPIPCQLCKRLCSSPNHLHALEEDAIHLCGQPHSCSQRCTAPGVCEIDMAPESIEETFRGMHECFQYTKYLQVAKRLKCVKVVPPGELQHEGSHDHSLDPDTVHYCQARCTSCQYYCILPLGHSQQEHETSHGSMSNVRWSIDGPDEEGLEVEGRRFSTNDEGAPMMCSLVCKALGRHVHIDCCRPAQCRGNNEVQHIPQKLRPEPDRPKDFLTHNLFWKRSGFKDPYSREEQTNFAKCDFMCPGSEHVASGGKPTVPSFCILPLFHAPMSASNTAPPQGHISSDGHQYTCKNPGSVQQPFHIIFLIDRSMSMNKNDRQPLENTPVCARIRSRMNNRLGAVYSALYSFWSARQATVGYQRDASTIILHAEGTEFVCENDMTSSPDELLNLLLPKSPKGGNNFDTALKAADTIISKWWDDLRPPVIIFLSDGIASVSDTAVQKLFQKTAQKGRGLSLHAILFGPKITSTRMERMVTVALEVQSRRPALMSIPSSFHEALDSVQLSQTFLGIAESLRKPRGALMPPSMPSGVSSDEYQVVRREPPPVQNPASVQQPFRSMSMNKDDRKPLENSPVCARIRGRMNNRLGAVYSALYNFWCARQAAVGLQRDANTVILHAQDAQIVCENDLTRSPAELLNLLLPNAPKGSNSFDKALKAADTAISKWWDDARPPVIIFLSDGIASVSDSVVRKPFQKTAQKGKGLSLHAILFGPKTTSARMERMVTVALDAQSKTPALTSAPSSFHEALDSVQLSQTFLGIAESLRKPRGALMQ
ncbi:hypothetical protein EV363DRAFT_1227517 [Boletus edulis]|nr:hypothetical protein EV363DRAFT_1227517 [Boletus edulis]